MKVLLSDYLSHFDVVIQFITVFFFGLTGLKYISNTFENTGKKFDEKHEKIFDYFTTFDTFQIDQIQSQLELIKFKCYYNLNVHIYPNRFMEIFYKGGIYCLFVLFFSSFLKGDEELSIFRFAPVVLYSFISFLLLSYRLFLGVKKDEIINDTLLESGKIDLDNLISPFIIRRKTFKKKYDWLNIFLSKAYSFFRFFNAKFVDDNKGRKLQLRLILHFFILFLLVHINWFNFSFINWIKSIEIDRDMYNKIITSVSIALCFLPYVVLFVFFIKNDLLRKKLKIAAGDASNLISQIKDKEFDDTFDKLKKAKEKLNPEN